MTIHLRTITDSYGDAIDYQWYCSRSCYQDSLETDPTSPTFEEGGAYPCGADHDGPDYCATCGAPIGNPLTGEGEAYVRDYVLEVENPLIVSQRLARFFPYDNPESRARATALRDTYAYLF